MKFKPSFTMLVGLAASGKSTWAAEHLLDGEVYLSSDAIRAELFGSEEDQTHNGEVFQIMERRAIMALKMNHSVLYDATNLNSKRRAALLKNLQNAVHEDFYKECIIFAVPFEECCEHNRNRERVVPTHAMNRMLKSFQPPWYSEGWNAIRFSKLADHNFKETFAEVCGLRNISQDNPHHQLTIGDHCIEAFNAAMTIESPFYSTIAIAALLHDTGKVETQTYTLPNGEPCEDAHYYNHENVSAYKALCMRFNNFDESWLYISLLISLHMLHYANEDTFYNTIRKFEWGGYQLRTDLELLYKCDLAAH